MRLGSDRSDWASRLAAAVASQVAEANKQAQDQPAAPPARHLQLGKWRRLVLGPGQPPRLTVHVHSIKATSPEVVEVVYSDFTDTGLKGIRIDLGSARSGSERIRLSSIHELAFDLIHLGMLEPRSLDEFLPPDSNGVSWLPLHRWLGDF